MTKKTQAPQDTKTKTVWYPYNPAIFYDLLVSEKVNSLVKREKCTWALDEIGLTIRRPKFSMDYQEWEFTRLADRTVEVKVWDDKKQIVGHRVITYIYGYPKKSFRLKVIREGSLYYVLGISEKFA